MVFGCIFLLVEQLTLDNSDSIPDTAIKMGPKVFIFAMLAVTGVGLLIGVIELFFLNSVLAKKSFFQKMLVKLLIYASFLFLVMLITFPIAASIELGTTVFDPQVWDKYFAYLSSRTNISTSVQMGVSLAVSLFYAEVSDNIGHGILINFFTGKYHNPVEEKRIFMFLDMKSSTTLAEQLGHVRYFELLKEYYFDLSDAIVDFEGEIYQYVGDEVVVSWKYEKGIKNNNCISCFYAMKAALNKRTEWYVKNFGSVPSFKAGFHMGLVTTGEIGVLKKEIIFTGDVLNATARIQALCNHYKVDILLSDVLVKCFGVKSGYHVKSLGSSSLRGRIEHMELFTIT